MLKRKTINYVASIVLLILTLLSFYLILSWWWIVLVAFLWISITICGSFFIQWNYHFTSVHSNSETTQNQVAITFDDGPHPVFTPQILDLLRKYNAKASFFCIGQQIEKNQHLVKRIISEGHVIGNHTYTHSKTFGFFSTEKVVSELNKTNQLIAQLIEKKITLYRPAFGVTNPKIEKAVKSLNLKSIGWSVRSLDTTSRSEDVILNRITSKLTKGDVILLHDTSAKTVAVLERLLLFLQEKHLESVAIDQLLEIKAYA